MEQCERLRRYNRWRRGDKRLKQPDPTALGELIDGVADRLEVLEREHQQFFERWQRLLAVEAAARNLVRVKGRHHTEQAFKALAAALGDDGA